MADGTAVTMSDSVTEQLRCFVCMGYLSCGPVRGLPDGNFICGRCSPNDVTVARAMVFEAVLSNIFFPCSFRQNGCTQRLLFGQTIDHELKCAYNRSFVCPSSLSCLWKGSMSQIHNHFTAKHPTLVKEKPDFKIDIDQDSNGTFVVVNNNVTFIVKYLYDTSNSNLKYDIRFCNSSLLNVSYKLQLINESDADCNTNLKIRNCSVFDDSFCDIPTIILELNKFTPGLDNPNCIQVDIEFKVQYVNVITENDSTVNLKLLDSLRCGNCHQYLIPPLYELKDNTICCDCAKRCSNCTPLNNPELVQQVSEISYPCRWHNCKSIVKSNNLRNHELDCQFRLYNCLLKDLNSCTDTFRLTEAINHYKQEHQAAYHEKAIFKILFSESYNDYKFIITMKNNTKILIQYYESKAVFLIRFYSSDINMKSLNLNFKHEHCKLKSKLFNISTNENTRIKFNDLPLCFRNNKKNEITVTVFV